MVKTRFKNGFWEIEYGFQQIRGEDKCNRRILIIQAIAKNFSIYFIRQFIFWDYLNLSRLFTNFSSFHIPLAARNKNMGMASVNMHDKERTPV